MSEQLQEHRLESHRGSWAVRSRKGARIAVPGKTTPYMIHQAPLCERKRATKKVRVAMPLFRSARKSLKSTQASEARPATCSPSEVKNHVRQKLHTVNMSISEFKTQQPNHFQAFYVRNKRNPSYFQSKEDVRPHQSAKQLQTSIDFEVPSAGASNFGREPAKKEFAYEGYTQRGRRLGSPLKSFRALRYREFLL